MPYSPMAALAVRRHVVQPGNSTLAWPVSYTKANRAAQANRALVVRPVPTNDS